MHIWIGVKNFAKVESVKICIDSYTVLVGPNNSGKTFLMQLIQGINKKISYLLDDTIMNALLVNEHQAYKEYVLENQNIEKLIDHINSKLAIEKEKLVKEIFGREIPIEELYVDILMEEESAYSFVIFDAEKKEFSENISHFVNDVNIFGVELVNKLNTGMVCLVRSVHKEKTKILSWHGLFARDELRLFKIALDSIMTPESLFFPASRTGLLLLYREFFANKTDKELSFTMEEKRLIENKDDFANVTQPIYEFLRFLQIYSEGEDSKQRFREELDFFEKHVIEGHISMDKQGALSYSSKNEANRVPMYLASSMINEVAPLVLAITSKNYYKRLIIDEIEASLHPQKQLELVRFLNRLNNKGMQLIVSTHSDTFVSKLNNLYILSEMVKINGTGILRKFNIEQSDLIIAENLHVYEFVIQAGGKSIVKEIKPDMKSGYQFDLFAASAIHLYNEAEKIGELQ